MAKRKAKEITNTEEINFLVNLTQEQASHKSLIMDLFADFGNGPKYNPYDIIKIPAGKYGASKKNKNTFTTTVGLWIFNKMMLEDMADVVGYVNEPITKGTYGSINKKISYGVLEDKITVDQLKAFIDKGQIIMSCCSALAPSHTMEIFDLADRAESKRKQLEKEHKKDIEDNNLAGIKEIEDGMIAWAKDELKDSEAADMYNSGARSSWGNHFKNMYLVKGPIRSTDGEYSYISTSHMEGSKKEDFVKLNDAGNYGAYSRSNKTKEGGYQEKLVTSACQHIRVDKPGSDCGTKRTITVTITNKNIDDYMYWFAVGSNGSLTEITSDNKDKFIGKSVKLRYSSLCLAKNGLICEKCAGTLFNRLGIKNVGLGCMIISSDIKNKAMSAFHDSTLNMSKMDVTKAFNGLS